MKRIAFARLTAGDLVGMLIAGCSPAAPAAPAPTTSPAQSTTDPFAEFDPQIPDPPFSAIRLNLLLENSDPSARDTDRLTLVVSNVSDKTISFKVYEDQSPANIYIVTDQPDVCEMSRSNGEPPSKIVAIVPGGSQSFHPLDPQCSFSLAEWKRGGQPRAVHGMSMHVYARWVSESQKAITSNKIAIHVN